MPGTSFEPASAKASDANGGERRERTQVHRGIQTPRIFLFVIMFVASCLNSHDAKDSIDASQELADADGDCGQTLERAFRDD